MSATVNVLAQHPSRVELWFFVCLPLNFPAGYVCICVCISLYELRVHANGRNNYVVVFRNSDNHTTVNIINCCII